jgi:hypothetical protein
MHYLPPLESAPRPIPFRWIFPLGQLGLCLFLLSLIRAIPFLVPWRISLGVKTGIMMFNAPGTLLHLPEALLRADHGIWAPPGFDSRTWQALTSSIFGMPFWGAAGRSVEALLALKYRQCKPQINWAETIIGGLIMCGGVVLFSAGVIFGFFIDHDADSFHLGAAGGLWTLLASLSIIARFRQSRLRKTMPASAPNTKY